MQSHGKDLKGQTLSSVASGVTNVTAGGAGDNTEVTGLSLDVQGLDNRPATVTFEIPCSATLDATETLTVTGLVEKSADGSTWTTAVASATLLTLTGASGGSTERGTARLRCDLIQSDCRYVRAKFTPDLSRAATDTAVVGAAVAVFGGLDATP